MMRPHVKGTFGLRPLLLLFFTATMIAATARSAEAQAESQKSPWLAGGLSFVIPGAGQAYNGEWAKGGLMFGGALISSGLIVSGVACSDNSNDCAQGTVGVLAYTGIWVLSMVDAVRTANATHRRVDASPGTVDFGPQLVASNGGSGVGLSLLRVRF